MNDTLVDVPVVVPCDCMEQVEDVHLTLCHLTCTVLRERMRQIEPPVWQVLESAGRQSGWQAVVASPSSVAL